MLKIFRHLFPCKDGSHTDRARPTLFAVTVIHMKSKTIRPTLKPQNNDIDNFSLDMPSLCRGTSHIYDRSLQFLQPLADNVTMNTE